MSPLRALLARPRALCLLAGLTAAAVLAGCQSVPAVVATDAAGQWAGRFSLTASGAEGQGAGATTEAPEERVQGKFELLRQNQQTRLDLFSPFGQTLAQAVSTPGRARLTTHQGQRYEAADPDSLTEQALGWRLPVSALPGWLAGLAPLDRNDEVLRDGWRVRVEQRFDNGAPRRLSAWWPSDFRPDQRRLKLYVVVDRSGS